MILRPRLALLSYMAAGRVTSFLRHFFTRVRPIRVKWPMFDVLIFRRKNSDSDGRCRCL